MRVCRTDPCDGPGIFQPLGVSVELRAGRIHSAIVVLEEPLSPRLLLLRRQRIGCASQRMPFERREPAILVKFVEKLSAPHGAALPPSPSSSDACR